eukprot:UN10155
MPINANESNYIYLRFCFVIFASMEPLNIKCIDNLYFSVCLDRSSNWLNYYLFFQQIIVS